MVKGLMKENGSEAADSVEQIIFRGVESTKGQAIEMAPKEAPTPRQ